MLTDEEVQAVRFHLGFGNLDGHTADLYTGDGYLALFEDVVRDSLQGGAETTATTTVAAGATVPVTVGDITDIAARTQLVVDVGDDAEVVVVRSISGSTFTAKFTNAHTQPYPVAVMSGEARLRMLLWTADVAWIKCQDSGITDASGLKSLDNGGIVWKDGADATVLAETLNHYRAIVWQISSLVRVRPAWANQAAARSTLEAY